MTNLAAKILTAAIAAFPDGACTFRKDRREWSGICTGLDEIKTSTEQGRLSGYSGNARYLKTDEPEIIESGDVLEVKRLQDTDYIRVRVGVRHETGGAVRLTIAAEFE